MKMNFKETALSWLWLAIVFIVIDQVTKQWVANTFNYGESLSIISYFNITYVHNPGAAFSFLADQPGWQRWFFTTISLAASILFVVWMSKTPKSNKLLSVALAFMLSGAVGNLIDRALFGYVIDFIDVYIFSYNYPVFNIADSAIFIGAMLIILDMFINKKDIAENNEKSTHE